MNEQPATHGRFGAARGTEVPLNPRHNAGTDTTVNLIHHHKERFYELMEDGASVGLLIYEQNPSRTSITHAMLRHDRRGNGLGTAMMAGALDHLYANNSNILVYCDSVAQFLARHPGFRSRVNPAARRHGDDQDPQAVAIPD